MVIIIYFPYKLLVLTKKHGGKSTIFLCATQIFRYKIAQFKTCCAQMGAFVQVLLKTL